MNYFFLVVLLSIVFSSCGLVKERQLKQFKTSILGEWEYVCSFNEDTTVIYSDSRHLPKTISFQLCQKHHCGISDSNVVSNILFKNTLNEYIAIHNGVYSKEYGDTSFPRLTSQYDNKFVITHYVLNGNNAGKGYEYTVVKMDFEFLFLKDDYEIIFNEKQYYLQHKYKRVK